VDYDAVVIGGGPAGLAAAGWLGRYRRRTLLVDAGEGRNRWAEAMHGLPGSDTTSPQVLRQRVCEEVLAYPDVEVRPGRVQAAEADGPGRFTVTVDGETASTRRIVLATGVRDVFPQVERFFDFYGADVHHCPTCDGYEARDRVVAAIGWSRHVAGFAVQLLDWAERVLVVTDGRELECEPEVRSALDRRGVEVIEDTVTAIEGERGAMEGLLLGSGRRAECTMAFFSIEHEPVTALAEQLGCALDDDGYVAVDHEAQTSVHGVFAAGDLTPGMQLVAVAIGKGTVAGVACATSLHGEGPLDPDHVPAPDPEQVLEGR
jgi:thioredoxin reductase